VELTQAAAERAGVLETPPELQEEFRADHSRQPTAGEFNLPSAQKGEEKKKDLSKRRLHTLIFCVCPFVNNYQD